MFIVDVEGIPENSFSPGEQHSMTDLLFLSL